MVGLLMKYKWTDSKGTHFEESQGDIKAKIENKISNSENRWLGNPLRQYLEHTLKHICTNLWIQSASGQMK
jgi:hypothetical protein